MKIPYLGPHCKIEDVGSWYRKGARAFQVYLPLDERKKIQVPVEMGQLRQLTDSRIILHAPVWTSMQRDDKVGFATIYSAKEHLALAKTVKLPGEGNCVVHVGYPAKGTNPEYSESAVNFLKLSEEFLKRVPEGNLLVENHSGFKGWNKFGRLDNLMIAVESVRSMLKTERIKVCVDVEHTYASGLAIEHLLAEDFQWSMVGCVHMNSIPKEVGFGSFLDRHSGTPLRQSKVDVSIFGRIFSKAQALKIPCILERRGTDLIEDDLSLLGESNGKA